jgi:hypothetical protein
MARWQHPCGNLRAAWLQNLPDNLQDTATAEALRAISELDLSELQAIVPPRQRGARIRPVALETGPE